MHSVISINGTWAQNIDKCEEFVDFMGTKGGCRLRFNADCTFFIEADGNFIEYVPEVHHKDRWNGEIDEFVKCVRTGEKIRSHIDYAILTPRSCRACMIPPKLTAKWFLKSKPINTAPLILSGGAVC